MEDISVDRQQAVVTATDINQSIKDFELDTSMAERLRNTFGPMADMLEEFEGLYTGIVEEMKTKGMSHELSRKAKRLRLDIMKIRTGAEKKRVEEKQSYLVAGRAIDGVVNILKASVYDREKKLEEIETYYERLEQERLDKIKAERTKALEPYDAKVPVNVEKMEEEVWNAYIKNTKAEFEAEKKRKEKEAKAAAEADKKNKVLYQRILELAQFKMFKDYSGEIDVDTTPAQYKAVLGKAKAEMEAFQKEQERKAQIAKELQLKLDKEEKARKEAAAAAKKKEEEAAAALRKAQAEKAEAEARHKKAMEKAEAEARKAKQEAEARAEELNKEKQLQQEQPWQAVLNSFSHTRDLLKGINEPLARNVEKLIDKTTTYINEKQN